MRWVTDISILAFKRQRERSPWIDDSTAKYGSTGGTKNVFVRMCTMESSAKRCGKGVNILSLWAAEISDLYRHG
jgi:hypothetical protein